MIIDRNKVHSLVSVFYRPEFKVFDVNSEDGESIINPIGVFVSLGMTTSLSVIQGICKVINESEEYSAKIVEISSAKSGKQFINTVINFEDPKQYLIKPDPSVKLLDKAESESELERLKNLLSPETPLKTLKELVPKVNRLQYFVDNLNRSNGWNAHHIQKLNDGEDYSIYHLYVNYKKDKDLEYRLGIYVTEKRNS